MPDPAVVSTAMKRILAVVAIVVLAGAAGSILMNCQRADSPDERDGLDLSSRTARRPDIIVILIDALRADRLGVYGHSGGLSPTLDRIAGEGALFERAVAQAPWTQPSVASLFSSLHPGVHRVLDYRAAYEALYEERTKVAVFGESIVTLPELLQQAGFATGAFVANPFVLEEFGFAQGFDHFDASFAQNTTPGSVVNEAALSWLARQANDRPFFCFLHYMDVHGPYDARPEFLDPLLDEVEARASRTRLSESEQQRLGYLARLPSVYNDKARHERLGVYREYWVARYDAGIREADRHVAELVSRLEAMGLWQDSYVVVTADHGEALNEHGHWDHGWSVHDPELRVPLILRWPAVLPAGRRVPETVQLIDLLPTLVDQLGLDLPAAAQGRTLVPLLEGRGSEAAAFAEGVKRGPEQRAVYLGAWKLMVTPSTNETELYDLIGDPLEQSDLSGSLEQERARLARVLREQTELNRSLAAEGAPELQEPTPEQIERLKSLGYVE